MNKIFKGKVKNGKLLLDTPDLFQKVIYGLEGKDIEVTIQKLRKKRSLNQNSWYWGVAIELISDHTGLEPEEVHDFLKDKFLKDKEIVIGGEKRMVTPSSTRLSTAGFTKYMEVIQRWALDKLDINIPSPGEIEGEPFCNY